jgi:DNA adenine methylase
VPDPKAAPFLRWAGGKRQLTSALLERVPDQFTGHYVEPFLGAGSLFFALGPGKSILSDANPRLIDVYRQIAMNPNAVRRELRVHVRSHSFDHYYKTRDEYNRGALSAAQAGRFIYLNKACFNGIFRVNRSGKFNVPKGSKEKLSSPTKQEFDLISSKLREAKLLAEDFETVLSRVCKDDFIYLDPPYPALNGTAYFTHYTADRFDGGSQERLAECVLKINNSGTRFLMSNADTTAIRDLYKGFQIEAIPVTRFISCKGTRAAASELLIRNY